MNFGGRNSTYNIRHVVLFGENRTGAQFITEEGQSVTLYVPVLSNQGDRTPGRDQFLASEQVIVRKQSVHMC